MQELYSILQGLANPQVKIFRSYLSYMSVRKDESNKQLELANFLLRSKRACPDENECSLKIYGSKEDYKIHQLKRRLRAKVLDVLTMDINLARKGSLDDVDFVSAKLKKKLLQFQVLYRSKGNLSYNKRLLDDIITESKEYELYEQLISALSYRKYFKGFCKGMKHFKEINKQIAIYEYGKAAQYQAADYYYQLSISDAFPKKNSFQKKQSFIQKCILQMKRDFKHTRSVNILYYLKLMEMAYFENYKEYGSARDTAVEVIELLKKNKSVYRKQRIGIAHDNTGYYKMYLGEYAAAAQDFQNAQRYFPSASANLPLSRDFEFNAWLNAGELKKAEAVSKELLKSSRFSQGDFRLAKYRFYNAALQFKKENFKGALKELNQKLEISKDKTGWDISIHLLIIMTNIELGRIDTATTEVESLQRLMKRMEKEGTETRERDKLIIRLLAQLASNGFSAYHIPASVTTLYQQLTEEKGKYSWQPLTPELIPFHKWIATKYRIKTLTRVPANAIKRRKRRMMLAA